MTALTPLIELAHQRSLDVFFRAGRGFMATSVRDHGSASQGRGLSPLGVQVSAKERIVAVLREVPPALQPYARPGI